MNWYQSTRCTHTPDQDESIRAWLVMTRNIFEPARYQDAAHWTSNSAQVPMESDQRSIAFLASHEYDVDRAWFNLTCQMGMGKDTVSVKRVSELINKQPIAALFQDVKEKMFRSGAAKPMLGAFVDESSDAVTTKDNAFIVASSKRSKDSKYTNYFDFAFPYEYAITKKAGGVDASSYADEDDDARPDRGASGRGHKDKNETKKRWQHILKESCTLLQRKIENPSEKPAAGIRRVLRGSTTAAEELLLEASQLGAFYDSPGDDFAEQLRVILGELIKQVISSREWVAELRDLMQPTTCYHGTRRRRPRPQLGDLLSQLKKADSLQLVPPEEASLKNTISQIQAMNRSAKQLFSHLTIISEGELEGEMPDLPAILESIANDAMIAPSTQSVDWIPTMEDVSDVLKAAEHISVDIPVVTFLSALWTKANDLVYEVAKFLDRAAACRTRTKVRSIGAEGKKHTIADARKLLQRVLDFPLDIGLLPNLERIITVGEAWQQEVQAIANQGERSKSQRQREKERDAEGNKPGSASIKRVESLISEGEKSVFNFEKELDILKERRAQAKQWLDKLKNSFRVKPKNNRGKREGEPGFGEDMVPTKMALADMRMMVDEGADLLEDESRQSATSRDLGKAQSIVDIAEEWLSRVREALACGGTNQDMNELQELIGESDDMPVYMEEAVVLRAHFNAMEWAKKARKVLYTEPPGYLIAESGVRDAARAERAARRHERGESPEDALDDTKISLDEDEDARKLREEAEKEARVALEEARVFAYPKLSEVQKIYSQIVKIRSAVPAHIAEEISLKPLIEETDTLEIVDKAEAWLNAAKKLVVGGSIKKGGKLKRIREMFTEANAFKVDFSVELKPFRVAVVAAENWIVAHASILERLNISYGLERTVKLEEGDEGYEEFGTTDQKVVEEGIIEPVTYNLLQRCVIAGESLLVDFQELDAVRQRLQDTDKWILRMKEMCSKSGEEIFVEKRVKASTEMNGTEVSRKASSSKDKKSDTRAVKYSDLVELLEEAHELGVNLVKEKEQVMKNIQASETYDAKVQQSLTGELSTQSAELVANLEKLIVQQPDALAYAFERISPATRTTPDFFQPLQNETNEEANDEEDASEHEVKLIEVISELINRTRASAEKKVQAVKAALSSDPIVLSLDDLADSFDRCLAEAEHIGIATSTTLTVDLCIAALDWVHDVRELLLPTEERKAIRGNAAKGNANALFLQVREWGNIKQDTLMAMIQDVQLVMSSDAVESFNNAYKGTLLESAITSIEAAEDAIYNQRHNFTHAESVAYQKLLSLTLPASQRRTKKEKEPLAKPERIEGDEEEELEAHDQSLKPRVSRKRKSKDRSVEVIETALAAVATPKPTKRGRKEASAKIEEESLANKGEVKDGIEDEDAKPDAQPEEEGEDEDEDKMFKSKFSQFKKALMAGSGSDKSILAMPESMRRLLDFYLRCLGVALVRTCEIDQWRRSAEAVIKRAMNAAVFHSAGAKRCAEDVLYLLQYADHHGYHMKERTTLENEVIRFNTWVTSAQAMQKRVAGSLLSPDELKSFTRDGERLIFDHQLTRDMKEELKRAKAWVAKLNATGIEKGLAKTQDLQELLPEVEQICADLSAFTETIYATTKSYCLCRQAYFGLMVGCDSCDDWYHAPCIGLSKIQAERTDAFICFRCTIADSLKTSCTNAANIVNKWMHKEDVVQKRENDKIRIAKKIQREEKEQERLQQLLDIHINNLRKVKAEQHSAEAQAAHVPSVAASLAPVSSIAAVVGAGLKPNPTSLSIGEPNLQPLTLEAVLAAADAHQIKRYDSLRLELVETGKRLAEAKKEDESNTVQTALETDKAQAIVTWMQKAQSIIWPSTKLEEIAGLPKGEEAVFTQLTNLCSADYVDAVTKLVSRTMSVPLIPDVVCKLATQSISQHIDTVDDVLAVVESFRWMSWCSVLLRTLRHPPTTVALRKLVDIGKAISAGDDRILRFLQNVILRSQIWKSKARKMLYYNTPSQPYMTNKRVDTVRANNLLLEGNQIPISSRIKDVLRIQLKNVARAETPATGSQEEEKEAEKETTDIDGKRSRIPVKKVEPVMSTTAAAPAVTHITFHGELPDTSDEDVAKPGTAAHAHNIYAQQCAAAKPGDAAVPTPKTALPYVLAPAHTLAETKQLWPVKLAVVKKEFVPWNEKRAHGSVASGDTVPTNVSAPHAHEPPTKKHKNEHKH